jgi:replication factor C subunit 3/5
VVINEVDRLSKEAQHALRRTMELYVNNCRLIMVGKNISKVIEPLRSRCLVVRIPSPSHSEIEKILQSIARKENVNLPSQLATTIAV